MPAMSQADIRVEQESRLPESRSPSEPDGESRAAEDAHCSASELRHRLDRRGVGGRDEVVHLADDELVGAPGCRCPGGREGEGHGREQLATRQPAPGLDEQGSGTGQGQAGVDDPSGKWGAGQSQVRGRGRGKQGGCGSQPAALVGCGRGGCRARPSLPGVEGEGPEQADAEQAESRVDKSVDPRRDRGRRGRGGTRRRTGLGDQGDRQRDEDLAEQPRPDPSGLAFGTSMISFRARGIAVVRWQRRGSTRLARLRSSF